MMIHKCIKVENCNSISIYDFSWYSCYILSNFTYMYLCKNKLVIW